MVTDDAIRAALPHALDATSLSGLGRRVQGKVRDNYLLPDGRRLLVATDRLSAFDQVLAAIPFKGQVLNQLSAWWFEQTADVVRNHVAAIPDPNVTLGVEAQALPVEVVVRGHITGVTGTALWTLYSRGEDPYGLKLPPGLRKNDALPQAVITPTTKGDAGAHDVPLSCAEVAERGLVAPALWAQVQQVALEIFRRGQVVAAKAGLILVDTKYEFGLIDGELVLIDEVHTPDSSRYWVAASYERDHAAGRQPEDLSKEHVRRWLRAQGYSGDGPAPPLSDDIRVELARRYIDTFERLTGQPFVPGAQPLHDRIAENLAPYRLNG
ncbi:MAG: phosphoribosylaminoimidazolesuccinocarboxamide synthase [Alphaproteobacteria bacterium]|nr:phosphoribosylaminoimidazolesuccinocarboxamide synthase [Alphaproteobacteria bacterium]